MKRFGAALFAAAFFVAALLPSIVTAQSLQDGTTFTGHFVVAGAPPAGTTCTIAAGSTDTMGSCATTSTTATVTFAKAFAIAPFCVVYDASAVSATSMPVYTVSTTAITFSTVISAHTLFWICGGKSGN